MRQVNLPQLLPFLANPRHPMEQYYQIGARLDRLPLARFHYRIFGIISFSLLLTGFLSYSGNVVLAKLVSNGWSNYCSIGCLGFAKKGSNCGKFTCRIFIIILFPGTGTNNIDNVC